MWLKLYLEKILGVQVKEDKRLSNKEVVDLLILLKYLSDKKMYDEKQKKIRLLLKHNADEFEISDKLNNGSIAGLTHYPSGFKIHTKLNTLPVELYKELEKYRNG